MRLTLVNWLLSAAALLLVSGARAGETTTTVESRTETRAGVPRFTLDQAILTALRQNPDILRTRQDIERTKGLYIEMRAAILPQLNATGQFQDVDPHLESLGRFSDAGTVIPPTPGGTPTPTFSNLNSAERSYNVQIEATQVIFAGGRIISQIRSADFQRDSTYYAFRNAIDSIVSTVRQQFYLVLLDRALIGVQEESVKLLTEPAAGSTKPI